MTVATRPPMTERLRAAVAALRGDDLAKASRAAQAVSTTGLADLAAQLVAGNQVVPFGPGAPIAPALPEEEEPRRWDYPVGFNIPTAPRTYEPITFTLLRQLARNYDVAQLAIQKRIDGLRRLRWDVRPKPIAGMTRAESRARRTRLEDEVAAAKGLLSTPDQEHDFVDWLARWVYDLFTIDAATLYLRPTLAGELYGLEVIDGATIRPIIDGHGRPPAPPMPAYAQVIKGMTRELLTGDQLVYAPFWTRADSPYGHPPMEWILLAVNRALRRQTMDLSLYTEGTLPVAFLRLAAETPMGQIKELRSYLDELLAGNDVTRARVIPIPGGTGTGLDRVNPEPTTEAEEWLMHITCAAYGVSPTELGFTPKGSGLGGKGFAETQTDASIARDIGLANHIAAKLNRVLAATPPYGLGSPELEFFWEDLEKQEDRLAEAQALQVYWQIGATTSDWIAENVLDQDPPGLGPVIAYGTTVMPLADFLGAPAGADAGPPPEAPSAAPGEVTATESTDEPVVKAASTDLARWERKALRALRDGRDPTRFESSAIAPPERAFLRDALAKAGTADDVRAAFELLKAGGSARPLPGQRSATGSGRSTGPGSDGRAERWLTRWA